ncbi:MAG: hypothetical protein ACREJO_18740 [Phycisphaerales bacterium]
MLGIADRAHGINATKTQATQLICLAVPKHTSDRSPTGRRYIEQHANGWRFLRFVHERSTDTFTLLGDVRHRDYRGSRPISITWELDDLPRRDVSAICHARGSMTGGAQARRATPQRRRRGSLAGHPNRGALSASSRPLAHDHGLALLDRMLEPAPGNTRVRLRDSDEQTEHDRCIKSDRHATSPTRCSASRR